MYTCSEFCVLSLPSSVSHSCASNGGGGLRSFFHSFCLKMLWYLCDAFCFHSLVPGKRGEKKNCVKFYSRFTWQCRKRSKYERCMRDAKPIYIATRFVMVVTVFFFLFVWCCWLLVRLDWGCRRSLNCHACHVGIRPYKYRTRLRRIDETYNKIFISLLAMMMMMMICFAIILLCRWFFRSCLQFAAAYRPHHAI